MRHPTTLVSFSNTAYSIMRALFDGILNGMQVAHDEVGYDRCGLRGTQEQWDALHASLTAYRRVCVPSHRRSVSAALSRIWTSERQAREAAYKLVDAFLMATGEQA